jgi:hypothetical protein
LQALAQQAHNHPWTIFPSALILVVIAAHVLARHTHETCRTFHMPWLLLVQLP